MTTLRTVIVTGANRGIGKAICQLIQQRQDASQIKLIATSRRGQDIGLGPEVVYPRLEIDSKSSIQAFAKHVAKSTGTVDVLINNAGIYLDSRYSVENVRKTLDVNYRGTLELCQAIIPLLSPTGRIVNLSSVSSTLKPYSEQIRHRFRDPNMTLEDLEQLVQEFEHAAATTSEAAAGFVGPGRSYAFSKSCVNALTRILAKDHSGLVINACCPGWVKTDMGVQIGRAPKTVEDGARIPLRVAFGDIGDATGTYWANGSVRSKEEGQVQEW